jgi:DNA polymerase III delta subunit
MPLKNSSQEKRKNLFLLTGENDYDLKAFLKKWECSSLEKYGEYNVARYNCEEKPVSELLGELNAPPFFGDGKRIFFLENFPPPPPTRPFSEKKKREIQFLTETLLSTTEDTVIVFIVAKPDKRTGAYKKIFPVIEKIYTFPTWSREYSGLLSRKGMEEATRWVVQQMKFLGGNISVDVAKFLIEFCGQNPWTLRNEVEKLFLFIKEQGRPLLEQDIKKLCSPSEEMINFSFSNALQSGKKSCVLEALETLFSSGESPQAIFNRDIITSFRQLLQVRFTLNEGLSPQETHIHPFIFSKLKGIAQRVPLPSLKEIYTRLLQIDKEVKTGILSLHANKSGVFRLRIEKVTLDFFDSCIKEQSV